MHARPPPRTALIAGGSIAGPATAFWLTRYGIKCTIVEKSAEFRSGGQNIDVRGAGRAIVERMGLFDAIKGFSTTEAGVRFTDDRFRVKGEFPASAEGFTAELEILRDDLSRVFVDATKDEVEYIYNESIASIENRPGAITAHFASGASRSFDFIIAADGLRSATRSLVFPTSEISYRSLGMYMGWFSVPRIPTTTDEDYRWAMWTSAGRGRTVFMRPEASGKRTNVSLAFLTDVLYPSLSAEEQKDLLRTRFADATPEAGRIIEGLEQATDLYGDMVAQVKAKHWSRGRFALVGDAAACPSPISGMGTSVSLVSAYVLAGELAKHPFDHIAAFTSYERLVRPYVEKAQGVPTWAPKLVTPSSRFGIQVFGLVVGVTSFVVRHLPARLAAWLDQPKTDFELPDYSAYDIKAKKLDR